MDAIDQLKALGPTASPGTDGTALDRDQLRTLAAQFEAILLSQMLKEMRASMFDDGEENGFEGPLGDTMYSELSLALSRAGGFGLARSLSAAFDRQVDGAIGPPAAAAVPAEAPAEQPSAASTLAPPVNESVILPEGRVTSSFGWRRDPFDGTRRLHKGADIAMATGTEVPAARAGRVTFAGERTGYGLTVEIEHEGGLTTRYAHLSEVSVAPGDVVAAGRSIARSGMSGRATGPHLHLEVLQGGQAVDPSEMAGRLWSGRPEI